MNHRKPKKEGNLSLLSFILVGMDSDSSSSFSPSGSSLNRFHLISKTEYRQIRLRFFFIECHMLRTKRTWTPCIDFTYKMPNKRTRSKRRRSTKSKRNVFDYFHLLKLLEHTVGPSSISHSRWSLSAFCSTICICAYFGLTASSLHDAKKCNVAILMMNFMHSNSNDEGRNSDR